MRASQILKVWHLILYQQIYLYQRYIPVFIRYNYICRSTVTVVVNYNRPSQTARLYFVVRDNFVLKQLFTFLSQLKNTEIWIKFWEIVRKNFISVKFLARHSIFIIHLALARKKKVWEDLIYRLLMMYWIPLY
jgi:hypothetical protein